MVIITNKRITLTECVWVCVRWIDSQVHLWPIRCRTSMEPENSCTCFHEFISRNIKSYSEPLITQHCSMELPMWCCFSCWSNSLSLIFSNHLYNDICERLIYVLRKNKLTPFSFYCRKNDKWISLKSLKTSYGCHLSPVQGFPLVPASIHAVARKKYFDDKWVMFQDFCK